MDKLNVNPTRMELARQKGRMKTAKRGHKLLKDKSDEMIRTFMELAKENKALREAVDAKLGAALGKFAVARTQMPAQTIESALASSTTNVTITPSLTNIMGLRVPKIDFTVTGGATHSALRTSAAFDESLSNLTAILPEIVQLAQVEKTCDMLAAEIIKIKRRINALEFILMPQIDATIRFINMKLAENERSQLVRVMKVKAQIEAQS